MTKRIWVAELGAPHGVRGEIRLRSFTGDPMRLAKLGPLESEDGKRVFKITALRAAKDMMIARLDGVASRDHAETLARTRLYVARDSLPPLDPDEFYHSDLIGLSVVDRAGQTLGSVCAVHNFGAGDILEYQPASGGQTQMAAFSQAFVPLVDLAAGRIVIDAPDAEEDEQDLLAQEKE